MTECVSTLAQLEKTPVITKCVIVEGYHKAGDGGGGTFYWDDSFDGTSDGGTTFMSKIVPVPPKGCWRRIFDGPISVKWFGARGDFDPTTGNGGDLDNTAIQAAMDLVKLIGLPLYFPPGKYKVTSTLQHHSSNLDADGKKNTTVGYWNSQQGLHVFGAGMQKSIIYNQIRNANRTGAAAISILRDTSDTRTFQQSGVIRDLQITSDKMIDGSVGIEMAATWAYTIQRVRIMKMGSHGIRIQNWLGDFDGTENLHLDNIVSEYNGGWGIVVDAKEGCESVGFIHIERCKITENKGGGIQWTGQIGVIERCGIYGNGVFQRELRIPISLFRLPMHMEYL
ncbi:MAG TPA: glycosyl hydrolase family 28-related protein [Nitrososphaeraceae archaeon]|nr:glycosyl hydrolase family 28-related protein [Nitrososphaeraceae archaeon]